MSWLPILTLIPSLAIIGVVLASIVADRQAYDRDREQFRRRIDFWARDGVLRLWNTPARHARESEDP